MVRVVGVVRFVCGKGGRMVCGKLNGNLLESCTRLVEWLDGWLDGWMVG